MKNWVKDVIKWYGDRDCKYEIISYENNSNKRFAWRFTSNRRKS